MESSDRERRTRRFAARELLRTWSSLRRLRKCGRVVANRESGVGVAISSEGVARFQNLQTCASVHACPVCAPRIRSARASDISDGVAAWLGQGGGVEFLTLTLPHTFGDRLAPLLGLVRMAWRSVLAGGAASAERAAFGIVGNIRALEVNHGPNGWHPHLHVLLFTTRPLYSEERRCLASAIGTRWANTVEKAGHRRPSVSHGSRLVAVSSKASSNLSRYLSKVDGPAFAGMELARGDLKKSRQAAGYRSAFQIAADLERDADYADLSLWWEYESATKGLAALRWSKGLRARLELAAELTDREIVEEVLEGSTVAEIEPGLWYYIAGRRGLAARVLATFEHDVAVGHELLAHLAAERFARERSPRHVLAEASARGAPD